MTPPERLTLKTISSNFLRDFLQAEDGLWGTIVQMTIAPRRVVETYLFEDRKKFIRPSRYLFFCLSIVAFQLIAIQGRYGTSVFDHKVEQVAESKINSEEMIGNNGEKMTDIEFTEIKAKSKEIVQMIGQYVNYLTVLFLPFLGLLYFILFPSREFNYAESLIAAIYLHAHHFLLITLLSLPLLFYSGIEDYIAAKSWISMMLQFYFYGFLLSVFWAGWRDILLAFPKLLAIVLLSLPTVAILISSSPKGVEFYLDLKDGHIYLSQIGWLLVVITSLALTVRLFLNLREPVRWFWWVGEVLLLLLSFLLLLASNFVFNS